MNLLRRFASLWDETRFRHIVDDAPVMVWMTEPDGACTYLSESWYNFTGQTPETGLGFGWLEAVHPDDRPISEQAFIVANRDHASFHLEYRLCNQNGRYHWMMDSAQPRFSKKGTFLGYIGSVIDITERKKVEDALQLSEAKYRTLFNSIDEGFCIIEVLFDEDNKPVDYRFLEVNPAFERQTGIKGAEGRRIREFAPEHEETWFEIYGKVALTGESVRFENPAAQLGFYYDVFAFRYGAPEDRQVGILFKDIGERKRHEDYSSLLYSSAIELSATVAQKQLIDIIHKSVKAFGATRGILAIVPDDKSTIEVIHSFGFDEQTSSQWHPIDVSHPINPIARAIRHNEPLWLSADYAPDQTALMNMQMLNPKEQVSWTILPFNIPHMRQGALVLGFEQPRAFDQVERDFLLTLAENFSQALQRTHLIEKLQKLATLEERQRLSRDLHDSVQQLLYASINLASALPRIWNKNPEQAQKITEELVELNQSALAEIRALLYELRPESLVQTPFITLLNNLSLGLKGQKIINVDIDCAPPEMFKLPEEIQVAMYRIAQEAIQNIVKHSRATDVEIDCEVKNGQFGLIIKDNGQGFDIGIPKPGLGLKTMRERAESVGAELEIESQIGDGTTLTIKAHI